MLKPKRNPCSECPFHRKSLAGYLGNATAEQFLATSASGAIPMPCHSEVDYEQDDWEEQQTQVHQCTGHAIYLSNICKRPETEDVQKLPVDRDFYFSNHYEFLAHGGDIVKYMLTTMPGIKFTKNQEKQIRAQAKQFLTKQEK
jgi:hypothetical protein